MMRGKPGKDFFVLANLLFSELFLCVSVSQTYVLSRYWWVGGDFNHMDNKRNPFGEMKDSNYTLVFMLQESHCLPKGA